MFTISSKETSIGPVSCQINILNWFSFHAFRNPGRTTNHTQTAEMLAECCHMEKECQMPEIYSVVSILEAPQKCHESGRKDFQFWKHMWEIPLWVKTLVLSLWKEKGFCQNQPHLPDLVWKTAVNAKCSEAKGSPCQAFCFCFLVCLDTWILLRNAQLFFF